MVSASVVSLTNKVTPIAAGAEVVACCFLAGAPAFVLANGEALLANAAGERRLRLHEDAAVLIARVGAGRMVSGGDDGRIMQLSADGTISEIANEGGKWIDALALRADGAVAWACARQVRARDRSGEVKSWTAPSSVRGMEFMAKGYRVAMAHYNGASLWFPNTAAEPDVMNWRGSHLDVTTAPDGRFVVTSMQENSLHGWRVADKKDMRMTGYPAKTRSLSWSKDNKWLATSGAEACIVWPFDSKDGPMGKGPRECAVRNSRVSQVAFHPSALVLAVGYEDGWVMISRLTDGAEFLVRSTGESGGAGISAMAWSADGARLLFGAKDGAAGVLDLPL